MACSRCGRPGHYAPRCPGEGPGGAPGSHGKAPRALPTSTPPTATPAAPPGAPDGRRRSPTCGGCGKVGHRAPHCPDRPKADPLAGWRPPVRLPLYLNPVPTVPGWEPPPRSAPRAFKLVDAPDAPGVITHVWRAKDGRTLTLTGPDRPIGCLSPEWFWEGRIALREVVDAAHAQANAPTFTLTESQEPPTQ